MTYEQALSYIDEIPKFTEKHSNEHTKGFLSALGSPQKGFRVIHVAGSNGKGSVCMMLYHTMQAAGMRVCGFFSPHLTDIRERFFVRSHEMCGREAFLRAFHCVLKCAKERERQGVSHPSYFEFLFLMGMLIFQEEKAEYVVLETGLGGRMDATNCIDRPLLTVITSISLEHREYLGDTIEKIAGEKAGIIKPDVPVVYDASNEEAARVIRRYAKRLSAKEYEIRPEMCRETEFNKKSIDFFLDNGYDEKTKLRIPFTAGYQVMNAAVAASALQALAKSGGAEGTCSLLTKRTIQDGIAGARCPGRMEEVFPEVYFDGAHNPDGIRAFLQTVRRMSSTPALLLFSMVRDRDHEAAARLLAEYGLWDRVVVTRIPSERGADPAVLREAFAVCGIQAEAIGDCKEALREVLRAKREGQYLFCTGSLYLVGALR